MKANFLKKVLFLVGMFLISYNSLAYAHCDSYDGPVIKDAQKAIATNNSDLILKWITPQQEKEVVSLFQKTVNLKNGDKEIYTIVEKHFLETLVRLHRETEGAPYTGLKPAGSTKPIIQMADNSIDNKDVDHLLNALSEHTTDILRKKYNKVIALSKTKNQNAELGRKYVEAYVDYTHTLEALHDIIDGGIAHAGH